MYEPGDLLDLFKFFRVVAENGTEEIWQTSSFRSISEHYTYTLCKVENECMQIDDGPIEDIDSERNLGGLLVDNTNNEVNLLTIT